MGKYSEKQKVKCASCGTETNSITLKRLKGIARWVCTLCATRMTTTNGG